MFLPLSVFTGGAVTSPWADTSPPPLGRHPPRQTPPPQADTPSPGRRPLLGTVHILLDAFLLCMFITVKHTEMYVLYCWYYMESLQSSLLHIFIQKVEKCTYWFRVCRANPLALCLLLKVSIWNEWILLFLIFFTINLYQERWDWSYLTIVEVITTQQINAFTDWMQSKNQLISCQELIFQLFTKAFYWWLLCSRPSGCFWLFAPKF